jgi:hypothetical protein
MLLELIEHHPGLFHAVIRALTMRRDCRSLNALAGSCRSMRDFLAAKVPLYGHYLRWLKIRRTEDIKKIMYVDAEYHYICSVIFVNDKLISYLYPDITSGGQGIFEDCYDLEVQSENTTPYNIYDIMVYHISKNSVMDPISNPPKWLLRNKKLRRRFTIRTTGHKITYKSILRKN